MTLAVIEFLENIIQAGTDNAVYFTMGLIATLIFVIRLALALFIGDSADGGDFDVDLDEAGHISGEAFEIFSLLSITAFFMGAGWMGFAARHDWQLGGGWSLVLALAFGLFMMALASGLMFYVRKLSSHPKVDLQTARGQLGRVYMQIPEHGLGQVEVTVSGSKRIYPARSTSGAIDSFTQVIIADVETDGTLVVEARGDA